MSTGPARKPLVFLQGLIKSPPFTSEGRSEAGTRLREIQEGEALGMPTARPMPSIGPECMSCGSGTQATIGELSTALIPTAS